MLSPKIALAMTEHSMCHPGRPGPQGDGQDGSPGFEAFHSAKSAVERRPVLLDNEPKKMLRIVSQKKKGNRLTFPSFQKLAITRIPRF